MRTFRAICITLLLFCGFTDSSGPALGDEPIVAHVMEALPSHLAARVRPLELPEGADREPEYRAISVAKMWPSGARIKVSFMEDIDPEACRKIATVAQEWTKQGSLSFDFGQKNGDDKCRIYSENDNSDIRISFRYKGYWSLVGTDCRMRAMRGEPTMNFEDFDLDAPPEPEFSRIVLHEFGHALGFRHDRQHPASHCEDEFAWDVIYKTLKGPPNTWDRATTDRNLRKLNYLDSPLIAMKYDKNSIMNDYFESWMFNKGSGSPCFTPINKKLSTEDRIAMNTAYPKKNSEEHNRNTVKALREVATINGLNYDIRAELLENLSVFAKLNEAIGPRILIEFTAESENISNGQATRLSWDVRNAKRVELVGRGRVDASGVLEVKPEVDTRYELRVTSWIGQVESAFVTVRVAPTLLGARVQFHTKEDGKDLDTKVNIEIILGEDKVAAVSDSWGIFSANSHSGWKDLDVIGRTKKVALVGGSRVQLRGEPRGNDAWRFDWSLELRFSDGSSKRYDWAEPDGIDRDRATLTKPL